MLLIFGQELQEQLQKSCQTCFVAPGKKFIIGGIFVMLHLEVTLDCNSGTPDKTWCVWLHSYIYLNFIYLLLIYYIF
jgi:hypothetical protein